MSFIQETLAPIKIPQIVKVKQHFSQEHLEPEEIKSQLRQQLTALQGYKKIKPGQRIAITAGSRGIDHMAYITRTVCDLVKEAGASPFIVPAMGSHGGATAEGQAHMLEINGITEESMQVPILSSMDAVQIGTFDGDRPIYMDKYAHEADGIILINRIKAHTSFRGTYESGLMKMMAIGLGKQLGAQNYHQTGYKPFPHIIEAAGKEVIRLENIVFAVGIIENSFNKVKKIACLDARQISEQEPVLLKEAYQTLPLPFFRQVDVMIVKAIGKNISGTGCDSNVSGRFNNEHYHGDISVTRMGLLSLTAETNGNGTGMGMADFITRKLFSQLDAEQSYPNAITTTCTIVDKIPIILDNDRDVIKACIKTSNILDYDKVRLCIIETSKNMQTFYITPNMVEEARAKDVEVIGTPEEIAFDQGGNLQLDFN